MTKNIEKKKIRRIKKHKHEENRDKREHSHYIPVFFRMGLAIMLLFAGIGVASATDYYVATWGSDSNPGTVAEPWRTIGKANQELQPGDTVYISEGTYTETIRPVRSGQAGSPITYKAYSDETPTISNVYTGADLNNRNYITLSGLRMYNTLYRFIDMTPANHCTIENCRLERNAGWSGILIENGNYNKILNNIIEGAGDNIYLLYNSAHNLIEGNDIGNADHGCIDIQGGSGSVEFGPEPRYNVIRNNRLHNRWHTCFQLEMNSHHNLIEKNRIYESSVEEEKGYPGNGLQVDASANIIRQNLIYSNKHDGFRFNMWVWKGTPKHCNHNRIYNNVFYGNAIGHLTDTGHPMYNHIFKNNIYFKNTDAQIYFWELKDVHFSYNNIIREAPRQNVIKLGRSRYTLEYVESNYPSRFSNNLEVDPQFVDAVNGDFRLQSTSPLINGGTHLTYTIGSGSGTRITVEDAGYFCDGFGIVDGDLIQVGSNSPVRILNVDYDNNIITVDQSISWNNNDGVSLPYSGSAPDIGAYESESGVATGTITGTVTDKDLGSGIPGATVTADRYSTETNTAGEYTLSNIPVGTYTVTASKTGYFAQSQENVEVVEEQTTTVNFQLTEAPDLVGLWHFDEGNGTTAADSSEYGNGGTLFNGPAWVDGKVGKALSFDGVDYVDCDNSASLDITGPITIMLWIKPAVAGEGGPNAGPVCKAEGGVDWSWQLRYNAPGDGNYMGFQFNGDAEGSTWVSVKQTLSPGEWYHIAGTYDGTNIRCYLNGVEKDMNQISAIKGGNARLFIGQDGWDNIFNGVIDEVKIYNRALSEEKIKADYDKTYPRYDVNEDGKADDLDISIVAQHYGETTNPPYPRYDVNEDGKVDISDTTIVGQHFGEITS